MIYTYINLKYVTKKKIMDTEIRIHNLKVLLYLEFW